MNGISKIVNFIRSRFVAKSPVKTAVIIIFRRQFWFSDKPSLFGLTEYCTLRDFVHGVKIYLNDPH